MTTFTARLVDFTYAPPTVLSNTTLVKNATDAIIDSIAQPVHIGSIVGEIGVNIGAAIYPLHAASPEDLLERADEAMYRAKQSGRTYCLYSSSARPEPAR